MSLLPLARASLSPDNQVSGCDAGREPFFQPLSNPPRKKLIQPAAKKLLTASKNAEMTENGAVWKNTL